MQSTRDLNLLGWFSQDELDTCPSCSTLALLRGRELRYCLACGEFAADDAPGRDPAPVESTS
jgi:hypothetical protein